MPLKPMPDLVTLNRAGLLSRRSRKNRPVGNRQSSGTTAVLTSGTNCLLSLAWTQMPFVLPRSQSTFRELSRSRPNRSRTAGKNRTTRQKAHRDQSTSGNLPRFADHDVDRVGCGNERLHVWRPRQSELSATRGTYHLLPDQQPFPLGSYGF